MSPPNRSDDGTSPAERQSLTELAQKLATIARVRLDTRTVDEAFLAELGALAEAAGALRFDVVEEACRNLRVAFESGDPGPTPRAQELLAEASRALALTLAPPVMDFAPEDLAELQEVFHAETTEHLDAVEECIERLHGRESSSKDVLAELFRRVHSLKAAGGVGFPAIGDAAHRWEDRIEELAGGALIASPALIADFQRAAVHLRAMLTSHDSPAVVANHLARVRYLLGTVGGPPLPTPLVEQAEPADSPESHAHKSLHQDTERESTEPDEQPANGQDATRPSGGSSDLAVLPSVPQGPPERRLRDRRRSGGPEGTIGELGGRRASDAQSLRVHAGRIDTLLDGLGEVVINRTRIARRVEEVRGVIRDLQFSRQTLGASLKVYQRVNPRDPDAVRRAADELVSATRRLTEVATELREVSTNFERAGMLLAYDVEDLQRISGRMQRELQSIRMMPVRSLFSRLQGIAEVAAKDEGKSIDIQTSGLETELDRTVAERLVDSLAQLVRNAVAHGIEAPAERRLAGKPERGHIQLSARPSGDLVLLVVEDDGAGVKMDRVRHSLARTGRMSAADADALSDEAVLDALFLPGLTTRSDPGNVAGRGIGLDVVQETVARLGGVVHVSSKPGQGTRFTVSVPLSSVIAQALLFKVGGQVYAIPIRHVAELWYSRDEDIDEHHIRVRDESIPVLLLDQVFGTAAVRDGSSGRPVLILRVGEDRVAAVCDRIIGPREIVVRSLEGLVAGLDLYQGATVSGAGKVQLVLDVGALARIAIRGTTPTPTRHLTANPDRRGRRLLIADDSRTMRESLSRMLVGASYDVETVSDGWEAWERLLDQPYDLLLTDLEMPRLGGLELLERVREALPDLPSIVLSSRTSEKHRARAAAAGANRFIPKPTSRKRLLEAVRQALGQDVAGASSV